LNKKNRLERAGEAVLTIALVIATLGSAPLAGAQSADPELEARIRTEVERQIKAMESQRASVGINTGGGGAFIKSADSKYLFRLLGYAQPLLTLTDSGNQQAFGTSDLRVRRARLDFILDYADTYKLFIEIDAQASGGGTGLVEGWGQAAYVKDRHFIRVGKFVTPFSTENYRSSRAIDTVERFIALNSLFGLPALDVQFGPMLFGSFGADKKLSYFVGAFNGNASAAANTVNGQGGNARDNNEKKETQARLNYQLTKEIVFGAAYDHSEELAQTLAVSSFSGARFLAVPVQGERHGFDVDAHYKKGKWSLDSEWLRMEFPDNPNNTRLDVTLEGGYLQGGYWLTGSEAKGIQLLLRAETAELSGDAVDAIDGNRIVALTAGTNIWFNPATRLQINAIAENVDGNGNGAFTGGDRTRPTLLSELQIKF
jgi:hypothetical protein